jgi:hypothetical protein
MTTYLCGWGRVKAPSGLMKVVGVVGVCARVPMLISVRDSGWLPGVGDMMVMGFPLGEFAVRPLGLWRPSTRAWRQQVAGSWPWCIG